MPTAHREGGEIDLASMRRLMNYLIESGAQGMSPNGGDSEGRHLKEEERMRSLEANNSRTPVLAGTTAHTVEEAARLTQHAQRSAARALAPTGQYDSIPACSGNG